MEGERFSYPGKLGKRLEKLGPNLGLKQHHQSKWRVATRGSQFTQWYTACARGAAVCSYTLWWINRLQMRLVFSDRVKLTCIIPWSWNQLQLEGGWRDIRRTVSVSPSLPKIQWLSGSTTHTHTHKHTIFSASSKCGDCQQTVNELGLDWSIPTSNYVTNPGNCCVQKSWVCMRVCARMCVCSGGVGQCVSRDVPHLPHSEHLQ